MKIFIIKIVTAILIIFREIQIMTLINFRDNEKEFHIKLVVIIEREKTSDISTCFHNLQINVVDQNQDLIKRT
jgi:hypothetical protein